MNICCVIVCYRPAIQPLLDLCAGVLTGNTKAIVVDNTETPYLTASQLPAGCSLLTQGVNTGIARAQNVGIAAAIASGAEALVFLDQDSRVTPGFLDALVSPLTPGCAEVTAPLCVDDASGSELPSTRVSRFGISMAVYCGDRRKPYSVDVVISSGTAATKDVFQIAGAFDESLFIDFVDTEWCLRCRDHGVPITVVPNAIMRHSIGNKSLNLGITTISVHSPIRCYYQIRNCFILFRRRHIPIIFATKQLVSVLVSRVLLLIFVKNRYTYVRAYASGLIDGLLGIAGPKPVQVKPQKGPAP